METEVTKALSDKDKQFNRQINYFIMRYMWQVVRGRNSQDTIYLAFGTSRARYTRVIDTGAIRYGVGELAGLQQVTGLRKEIFTGEVRFDCPVPIKPGSDELTSITTKDWEEMFNWRKGRKQNGNDEKNNKQADICKKLRKVNRKNIDNNDFYRLCYFLQERKAAPVRELSDKIRGVETAIRGLSFDALDGCQVGQLNKLSQLMKSKLSLINGIIIYKNGKADSKKEK